MSRTGKAVMVAWLVASVYYFYQYVLRSSPAVMMTQMSEGFGISAGAVASLVGLFYYGYSPFSLVAGVALDRLGPRRVMPIGAAAAGLGALLFASGSSSLAGAGRFIQGAGGVFALVGAAYIASTYLPASRAATLLGATQMFGMAGGAAGQFVVGPMIGAGVHWSRFWAGMGIGGLLMSVVLFLLLPKQEPAKRDSAWAKEAAASLGLVFRNPHSILCGLIAGLLFIPTSIFDMIWGVRYLQEARGFDYPMAVIRSSTVPFGWIIGCPLLGLLSDRIGRRKPVIVGSACLLLACLTWILYGPTDVLPPYVLGLLTGFVSGAAMLPYTVIKEVNPPRLSGTSTGVVNFINFTLTALLGPLFASALFRAAEGSGSPTLAHYQSAFLPMIFGISLAVVLTFLLKETGPGAKAQVAAPAGVPS